MHGTNQKRNNMKKITIIGNVGRIPALRTNSKGTEFYEFSVAINGKEDACMWVSVILRKTFEKIVPYLTKGKNVYIEGDFGLEVFRNEPSITIYANDVQLLGNKNETQESDVVDRRPDVY
jgi:single-stranded DNA-binding protein